MSNWREFIKDIFAEAEKSGTDMSMDAMANYRVYPGSIHITDECSCFIAWEGQDKVLVVASGSRMERFDGRDTFVDDRRVKICPLSLENSRVIRSIFPFANPTTNQKYDSSIGLGDRLGLSSPGHIRLIKNKDIFPVLAQQSIRELNLTNRTFDDVLASAVWAVFQEGYEGGYGADGDHLKTAEEVKQALDYGYTMITLDCSEYINAGAESLSEEQLRDQYMELNESQRMYWESKYLDKAFDIGSCMKIHISANRLMQTVLMYRDVLGFIDDIYKNVIAVCGRDVDFEISIDETSTSTAPEVHYMIAAEIKDRGIKAMSLAPRFCGEFQKGIDYKGDIERFKVELKYHAAIARHFDYKISVHSGSDKFSVFPAIGDLTGHKFHLKTAGTNWLEALGVIAKVDSELFLSIYKFALEKLNDAKKFYHITTERHMVPEIELIARDPLYYVRNDEAVRQVLHVTYGYILCQKDADNHFVFRDRFYDALNQYETTYYEALYEHINRHLTGLGIGG